VTEPKRSDWGKAPNVASDPPRSPLDMIRALMRDQGYRGNPRDYAVLSGRQSIQDHQRQWTVQATLPPKLEEGSGVWVRTASGGTVGALVVADEGEQVVVKVPQMGTFRRTRAQVYATGIPEKPTVVHKRDLRRFVGEKWGALFWNPKIGRRVGRPRK
jgi:hypothetical protein